MADIKIGILSQRQSDLLRGSASTALSLVSARLRNSPQQKPAPSFGSNSPRRSHTRTAALRQVTVPEAPPFAIQAVADSLEEGEVPATQRIRDMKKTRPAPPAFAHSSMAALSRWTRERTFNGSTTIDDK